MTRRKNENMNDSMVFKNWNKPHDIVYANHK